MMNLSDLHCYGCAHSAASEPFPGKSSGERPCCFCIRQSENKAKVQAGEPVEPDKDGLPTTWYDGSTAVRVPMDCYHSLDMKDQISRWTAPGGAS